MKNYVAELEKGKSPRAVDLDEQWNVVSGPKNDDSALLQELSGAAQRLAEADRKILEQDEIIQELKSKLSQMQVDRDNQFSSITSLPTKDPADQESILAELRHELKESRGALEEWREKSERVEVELESLRKKEKEFVALEEKLATYEESLAFRVEDAEKDLHNRRIQVQQLDTFVRELAARLDRVQQGDVREVAEVVELHAPVESQLTQPRDNEALQQTDALRLELQERDLAVMELRKAVEDKANEVVELEAQLRNQEELKAKIAEAEALISKLKSQATRGSSQDASVQQDELIALRGALELKNDECERLEAKLRAQSEKLKKAVVNLKAKTVANNDLTDKVTKLQSAIESNQALVDNLSKDKNEILEKWQTESSEKVEVLNELANVKRSLEEKEREIAVLVKEIETKDYLLEETKVHLDNKIVEMVELEASLAEKDSQLAALKERVAATPDHEDGAEDSASKDAQITKFQNVAKSFKAKLAKEKKARAEVEEKLTALEQTLEEVQEKLNQHELAYEAKVLEYEAYVDSLKQELDRERQQLCHLSESLADAEHRSKNLENHCQKLEQQIGEAHRMGHSELENELDRRRHEAEDRERSMVRELHNLRDENKELSQNLGEAELSIKALQMELAAAVGKMSEMNAESERRAVWEEEANSVADDVRSLEAKMKAMAREHKQQMEDQIAETNQLRESLQNELDDAREYASKLEAEISLLREQISMTVRAEQELAQDVQQKESELEEMRQVLSAFEDQRKQQIAEMAADLDSFKLRVSELESGSPFQVDDGASARISELNTTVQALTGEIEMMKAQAKKSESQDDVDRPSIPQQLDTHVTASQLMSSLNSMVLELEAELNQVWSERDQALAQIDQLMNNSLDESLMEKNMNKLESELSGMVTSLQDVQRQSGGSASCDGPAEASWTMEPTGRSDEDVWKWDSARPDTAEHLKEKFSVLEQRIKKKLSRMSLHLKQGAGDSRKEESSAHTAAEDRYQKLTNQIKELETERNDALSQMKLLRAEMDKLTSGMEKGLPLGEASVAPTPTIETPGWDDDPDGWGWGDKAEDEVSNEPSKEETPSELRCKIAALETEREQWESERAKLAEDLKVAQVRSVKLAKKMKEMKQKYETAKVSTSSSLDQALEEEFLLQIKNLEKDLSDAQAELTSIRAERDSLAKQVQMLTSGNERLVEMKERQDFEVEMWQRRSDDLQKKINALEWEIAEVKSGDKPLAEAAECSKCAELEKQLALLSGESAREALEAHPTKRHEEQKVCDIKPLAVEQLMTETHTWSSKYETLMQEYQQVRAQCIADTEKLTKMEPVVAELTGAVERLENEKKYLQDVHDSLKMEFESICAQLNQTQEVLIRERNAREGELSTRLMEETLLKEKYEEVLNENEQVRSRCRKLEEDLKEKAEAAHSGNEVEQLKYHLSVQSNDLAVKDESIFKLESEVADLRAQLQSAVNEANAVQLERTRILDELTALTAAKDELQGKLEAEVAQLKLKLSEQSNILTDKEQAIERLEAELLNARKQIQRSVDGSQAIHNEPPMVASSAIAIAQPEVRSTADWFSSQSHPVEQSLHIGTPPTSVFNWDAMTSGGHTEVDVFETIKQTNVSLKTQAPPDTVLAVPAAPVSTYPAVSPAELEAKEAELQKMTRLVETMKLTHSEAEQEWNHAMEYTKIHLQTALDELERFKDVLSARERELNEVRESFERSSQEHQNELANRDRELKSKESQIEALQADLSQKEKMLLALQEGELSQLQLQLAEKDQLLLQVQAKRDHDLSEANQQITDLKTKLSQKEWQMTEITMARERELALRDEVKGKELKEQIAEKDQQLSEERQRLQAQIEALQMTADQQAATIRQLQTQTSDSSALEEMRLYAEEQARTVLDLRSQVEVLNQELNDARQYSQQQASALQSLQHQLQSKEEELGRLRLSEQKLLELEEELEQLREKVVHREKTIERLQASIQWMEEERSTLRSNEDFLQLESNLVSKENELALLRQELTLKEEFVTKLQAEAQTKDMEIQELQDKIQRLEMKRMWDAEVKANREAAARLEQTAQTGDTGIRSDLDQALNILHQRDVRCEELTLELMRVSNSV